MTTSPPPVGASSVDKALASQLHDLLDGLKPSSIPTGILVWFGTTALPDGRDEAPSPIHPSAWQAIYARLCNGDRRGSLPAPFVQTIGPLAAQPGEPVPIVIASVTFDRPTADAAAATVDAARNGTLADFPDGPQLESAETTIAMALLAPQWQRDVPAHRGRDVELILKDQLLITNQGGSIDDVTVTYNGTTHPLSSDNSTMITVPSGVDTIDLVIDCRTERGPRRSICTLAVVDDPVPAPPDETWQLQPDDGNPGCAYVWRAKAGDRMSRPVLIAEGWPGGASSSELAEALGQHNMLGRLLDLGHDVIAIGFKKGLDRIQSNSGVVEAAIERTRSRTDDELVVGGMSMGGLVSRYALTKMEHDGLTHGTAVYLSIDSPHGRGAYTSVAGQWFVNHFTPIASEYALLKSLIQSRSNLQFVSLIERDGRVGPDPLRTEFLTELEELGNYPARPVKLAIACGTGAGNTRKAPIDPILTWHDDGIADVMLSPMPSGGTAIVAQGATLAVPECCPEPLVVTSDICWESLPGAFNLINMWVSAPLSALGLDLTTSLGHSSAVPTVSALDIDGDPNQPIGTPASSNSPFDDFLCAKKNRRHLDLSSKHVNWIVSRIEEHQPPSVRAKRSNMPTPKVSINPETFNPNDPDVLADPYPTYKWFRDNLPVASLSLIPGHTPPSYWIFRDEDVRTVLETTDVFHKHVTGPGSPPRGGVPPVFGAFSTLPPGLLSSDPPRHTEIREIANPSFENAMGDAAAFAEQAVAETLGRLSGTRRLELVQDFAVPVPSTVLAQVLGLPVPDLKVLSGWVESVAMAHNVALGAKVAAFGGTCAMAMRTYYDALIYDKPSSFTNGMLAGMCEHIDNGLDRRDVQVVMSDMLVAGFLTTTYLISTGMTNLFNNPTQLEALRNDDALIGNAVEEMLRFDAPAQLLDRQVAQPVTLGGVAFQPGAHLVVAVGSANHDGAAYPDADSFDIHRSETKHLGFGDGIHHCIGAPLARIVVPAAIRGLLQLEDLRLDGLPQWQADPYLRGMTSLPIAYGS